MEKQSREVVTTQDLYNLTIKISQESFECLPGINTNFKHRITFNSRLRTTAGRYLVRKGDIEINPHYYERYGLVELIDTIKHELVHYYLHQMGLPYQHKDKEFKALSSLVGCSRYAQPMREYKYVYTCTVCSQLYHRVKRINTTRYRCGKCKGNLTLKNNL